MFKLLEPNTTGNIDQGKHRVLYKKMTQQEKQTYNNLRELLVDKNDETKTDLNVQLKNLKFIREKH